MNDTDFLINATEALLMELVPERLARSLSDEGYDELVDSISKDLQDFTLDDARTYLKERVATMLDALSEHAG